MAIDNMTVSEQLREAIRNYGSVYRVAKDSGLSQATLNRFVNGERGLSLEAVDTLAQFFGTHLTRPTRKPGK